MAWTCPETVRWIRFSPNGLLVATASQGEADIETRHSFRLWDALSGRELAHLVYDDYLRAQAFASDRVLLIMGEEGCRLWDTNSSEVRDVSKMYSALAVLPSGKAVGGGDGNGLRVFDPHSRKAGQRLTTPPGTAVYHDEMASGGQYLAACCRGQTDSHDCYILVALWDYERGKRLRTYAIDMDWPHWDYWPAVFMAFHPEGPVVAVATSITNKVQSFGFDDEEPLEGFTPFACKKICDLRYSTDGRTLLVLGDKQLIRLDARTGQALSRFKIPSSLKWDRGVIDPNGEKVAVVAGQRIEVLDIIDA